MPLISSANRAYQDAAGVRTHYVEAGEGNAVVLLHGSGAGASAATNWWRNVAALSSGYHVLAPDFAGFGDSDRGDDLPYGIELWSRQIVEFLDALSIERATLVGNSLGGWVALDIARHRPERLDGLVLMGTGGTPQSDTTAIRRHRAYEPGREAMRELLEDFVYSTGIVTDELVEERYLASVAAGAPEAYAATTAARARDRKERPVDAGALQDLAVPTLVLHGKEDQVIPVESSWQLARALPTADLHVLARCGHWTQIEHARTFNSLVLDFLHRIHHPDLETERTAA
ncbi:MAG: hypothetical protein JWQ20_3073 [Conexibacter sp.]|nr:hypothetical protein [Conexibacter sp.]